MSKIFKFSGQNQDINTLLENVEALVVTTFGTTMTLAQAKTKAQWSAVLNPATTAAVAGTIVNIKRGFENKTEAPEMSKSNIGQWDKTGEEPPRFTGMMVGTFEEYKLWWPADGLRFSIVPVLKDAEKLMTLNSTGTYQGFTGRMWLANQLPMVGADKQKQYTFDVIFEEMEEWKDNVELIPASDHNIRELKDLMPVGLNVDIVTPYAVGGDVTVKVTMRSTKVPYAEATTATEWEVVGTPAADLGVTIAVKTITNASQGVYVLTVKSGLVDLVGTAYIRALKITASKVTHLSNPIAIKL